MHIGKNEETEDVVGCDKITQAIQAGTLPLLVYLLRIASGPSQFF